MDDDELEDIGARLGLYDRQGNRLSMSRWILLTDDEDYRRVASTDVGPYWVSTVWLGMDHSFGLGGRPILFETMVFQRDQRDDRDDEDVGVRDLDCVRYWSEEEALKGHEDMVTLIRATLQEELPTPQEQHDGEERT